MMLDRVVAWLRGARRRIAGGGKRRSAGCQRRDRASVVALRTEVRCLIAAGHSQAEAARRLGVTRQYVHKLVRQQS
jgi:hypothetical protein